LGLIKALPLAYAKDLQDDKVLTFEAFDAFELSLAAMIGMMDTITFNRDAMRAAAARGFSTATDLADWLVRDLGVPFRQAHHITGAIVKRAEALGLNDLAAMPLDEMQKIEPRITADVQRLLSVEGSVDSRMSYGGAAPAQVRAQIKRWKEILA
jgi:argininosuccinate lyase